MSQHQTALQAGSLNYNGPRQIYRPKPIILAVNSGGGESSFTTTVKVPVPSSQTRIKLSVIFVPAAGNAIPNIAAIGSIWVAACDEDQGGAGGGGGLLLPVTDVEGSSGTPTPFPQTNGLSGYSRTFVTDADWLQAVLVLDSVATPGAWMLQTLIQPNSVYFPWEAWDQIRRAFDPVNLGGQGAL